MTTESEREEARRWGPRGTAGATFAARLTFERVSHSYQDIAALADVSFELAPGEIVCLLGPSGCGKTTLLRIAAGVERPVAGRVLLNGQEVSGPGRFVPPEQRGVGLMFQDFALFPHLTLLENVAFGLRALRREEALAEARNAIRRVGLSTFESAYPHELSGGEQQRVALARAIVPRPAVMLMDEPFSGLDQRLRDSVRDETLAILKETRASCVLVTHDPVEAMWLADRIALMRRGRLVQTGAPVDLYRHPVDAEAARFFSDFNELTGRVSRGAVATPLGRFAAPGLSEGQQAVVLIRPHGLFPVPAGEGPVGLIADSHFLGDSKVLSVLFQELDAPMRLRVPGALEVVRGDTRTFRVDRSQVFVFAAAGG